MYIQLYFFFGWYAKSNDKFVPRQKILFNLLFPKNRENGLFSSYVKAISYANTLFRGISNTLNTLDIFLVEEKEKIEVGHPIIFSRKSERKKIWFEQCRERIKSYSWKDRLSFCSQASFVSYMSVIANLLEQRSGIRREKYFK